MIDLDALLADPAHRPPEGWSVRAEAWAHDRDTASWREVAETRRPPRPHAPRPLRPLAGAPQPDRPEPPAGKETDPHG